MIVCIYCIYNYRTRRQNEEKERTELQNRILLEKQKQESTKLTEEQQVWVYTLL